MKTIDGFPIHNGFNFLPDSPDSGNEWSNDKVIKIGVMDFYRNPRWIIWKDEKIWVADFELFTMIIAQWIKGDKWGSNKSRTKEQALDEYFEIMVLR